MNEHRHQYAITTMCRVLRIARAGFYQWLHKPVSERDQDNDRLLKLIRDSYAASRGVYGALRVYGDLREAGESCGKHRVLPGGRRSLHPNISTETVDAPNKTWVTDITYIRTWQGWLYLAVVVDLYARKVVGWSMKPTLARELALDALLMALWRRRPKERVLVHSDQGSQYGSDDWKRFCLANNLRQSMSRRGNCWDNAVAESNQHRDAIEHLRGDLGIANAATARAEGAKELLAQQLEIKTNEVSEALSEATAAQRREGDVIQRLASAEAEIKELRVNSDASDMKA